jgi:hypothetical protein
VPASLAALINMVRTACSAFLPYQRHGWTLDDRTHCWI